MNNTTILIPLAGAGQRFVDAGYNLPKPLIPVSGKPMIIQAAQALPRSDQQIFVCRKEHLDASNLKETLRGVYPNSKILEVGYLTEGQASTCLLAKEHLRHDGPLHIGACDNSMVYDMNRFQNLFDDADTDVIVWTFRGNPTVSVNPKAYGWCRLKEKSLDLVSEVSCKVPVSNEPMKDHAVVGAFSFKRSRDFVTSAEDMIKSDARVNGEFYVDHAINFAIARGLKVKVFEIEHYICWGTPNDLKTFEYWQSFFDCWDAHPYKIKKDRLYAASK